MEIIDSLNQLKFLQKKFTERNYFQISVILLIYVMYSDYSYQIFENFISYFAHIAKKVAKTLL